MSTIGLRNYITVTLKKERLNNEYVVKNSPTVVNVAMVSHIALLNVEVDKFDRVEMELIGNHILFSQIRNDQVETSNIIIITHVQLLAGYVCKKARRIKEIVIGTRLRYPMVRDEAASTNGECNVTPRAIK